MDDNDLIKIYPALKQYGYAPGSYIGTCRICNQDMTNVDKRARTCLSCAFELFTKEPYQYDIFDL